jgi:hypothetical protein
VGIHKNALANGENTQHKKYQINKQKKYNKKTKNKKQKHKNKKNNLSVSTDFIVVATGVELNQPPPVLGIYLLP